MSRTIVLDASALLCLINEERGAGRIADVLTRSVIGATSLAEVVAKLRDYGLPIEEVQEILGSLHLDVRPLTANQALVAGDLRPSSRALELSLGDRACLALAIDLKADLYTTDAALARADIDVTIELVR